MESVFCDKINGTQFIEISKVIKKFTVEISKITSTVHFNATETDGKLIFQQLYSRNYKTTRGKIKKNYIK
ncbi:conserved hypothetical protein [Leptospira interrogans serovar Manilae]|uniref:Uncharacterized protein n=1 Tax=Leptospira interrogans serovar Manilae TaxID=214675 RepID=A0AAQ1SPC0_LEPIR|nr:hypothetical protein LIMLP_02250 [Leptospira interrogans serovar Manilae]AKP28666.1 hypothetical protein LIMHP_02245 [Leptospira interrogans serovar Manilae]SOR62107.1 conserved hypothetical protein [Leptospira interrogans serovar Manilae]